MLTDPLDQCFFFLFSNSNAAYVLEVTKNKAPYSKDLFSNANPFLTPFFIFEHTTYIHACISRDIWGQTTKYKIWGIDLYARPRNPKLWNVLFPLT